MNQRLNPSRLVLAVAILALTAAGCQGGGPSSATQLMPASTGAAQSVTTGGTFGSDMKQKPQIISSCGKHIKIVLLGIMNCRFHEVKYDGDFTITNHTNGLIGITPTSGDKTTTFTITGLILGSGYFLVQDTNKTKLKVFVKVISV
jgi:hypothetical protein